MTVKSASEVSLALQEALEKGIDEILQAMSEARKGVASKLFTDDELEFFYSIGYTSYTQARFKEALAMFQRLARYRPAEPRFLKALAASNEVCGNLVAARDAYALLMCVAPDDLEAKSCHERCAAIVVGRASAAQASPGCDRR